MTPVDSTLGKNETENLILSNVYVGRFRDKYIRMPSADKTHYSEFLFFGFTKKGNVRMGEIYSTSENGYRFSKKYGKYRDGILSVCNGQYQKSKKEMIEESF